MMPHRCHDPYDWHAILTLVQGAFAFMEGRIDPPSSMHTLTPRTIADQARSGEVWAIGATPIACVFFSPRPAVLYIGKLAVAARHRRQGLARRLIDLAEARALALNLPTLELQTRVELVENQATFRAMGFAEYERTAHPGFDRPTSITYHRPVARAQLRQTPPE
jgi:ribosomal protein S18 acetylase RimI-like enzyme